jgi:BirA family biotin operon repressor/biotin-[acetyl-CoA-carboxylase] ligase
MNVKEKVLEVLEEKKGESISGGELAAELGVSRNAVWKAVKSLQSEGYTITAATNRGYALAPENDILSVQSISKYLLPELKSLQLEVYKSIDSTNTRAKEYAAAGKPEGMIIIAEEQTAGRGRMGRKFYSPQMSGVYISFLLRPMFTVEESLFLTTAAAVAAAEAIEEASGVKAEIKWVNDVFCHGKKVCGILTEASVNVENSMLEYAVTGIGFNIREPEGGFPEDIRDIAGPIFVKHMDCGEAMSDVDARSRIAAGMINHFWKYYEHLTEKTYMPEYRRRSFLIGKEVRTLSEPSISGVAVDVDEDGHLILELPDGSRTALSSGEVSVRPVVTE